MSVVEGIGVIRGGREAERRYIEASKSICNTLKWFRAHACFGAYLRGCL